MAIQHDLDNLLYEFRAKIILEEYFNNIYTKGLYKSEKPDLISNDNSVGVEETKSFYKEFEELRGINKKTQGKCVSENLRNYNRIEQLTKTIHGKPIVKDNVYYGFFGAVWVTIDHILQSFIDKLNLLPTYTLLENYDLYITSQNLNEYDIDEILVIKDKMLEIQNNYIKNFRFVYLFDRPNIYQFDLNANTVNKRKITKEKLLEIDIKAKEESIKYLKNK